MPKVSRITKQKRNKQRYNIFLEHSGQEAYGFSVEEDTLISETIHKGQELDQITIDALLAKDTVHKGYSLALTYLGFRMRSIQEMKQYLAKKEIDSEHITVIITRLCNEQLLNDQAFAKAFVQTKINTTSKGPLLVKKELMEKGVNGEISEQALAAYTVDEQVGKIVKWLGKQANKTSQHAYSQRIIKQKQNLMQKGFTHQVIAIAFEQVKQPKDDDQEWRAVIYQGERILRKHARKWEGVELEQKVKASLYQKGFGLEMIERFIEEYIKHDNDFN